ncbi:MAG: hypothetical protein QM680_02110 [Luteolibacter sp.]
MKQPVLILSDLHLGHKVSRIEDVSALRPLLRGAGTVIFNGDTWQEMSKNFRPRSEVMLAELKALCAEENIDAVFLSGNHDPGWPGSGWAELAGGKIIITHGDGLLFSGAPWKREIMDATADVQALWDIFPGADKNAEIRLRLAREIARRFRTHKHPEGRRIWHRTYDAIFPPKRAMKMLTSWLSQGSLGSTFAERYFPKAEILVIGHFHWHGTWLKNHRRIINTGSFVNPGRADYLEWNNGYLIRGVIHETPTAFTKGRILGVWRV